MSEELSRVKSRKKKVERKQTVKIKKSSKQPINAGKKQPNQPIKGARNLSRTGRRPASKKKNPSGNGRDDKASQTRAETYSSERVRLSKMFVNSLIFIFIILLALLLLWGIKGAPPLRELW